MTASAISRRLVSFRQIAPTICIIMRPAGVVVSVLG
jgi:hypothetical protein